MEQTAIIVSQASTRKVTVVNNDKGEEIQVFLHSVDAFDKLRHETIGGKPLSYHKLRRRIKNGGTLVLDSGLKVVERGLIA